MKKIFLSLVLIFAVSMAMAQIQRQFVLLEIGTGTWCTYCPGAAMGADDLLEAGCMVAVIENHNGDPFANQYSNARNSYYTITGYPTAIFDGVLRVVGGSHSSSMYNSYLPKYNQRMAVPSNIRISMTAEESGGQWTAVVTMEKVGNVTSTNMKLHFAVTQSHISYNWQGQNHLNFVNRLMVPDQNGTSISFTSGDVQTVTLNFPSNSQWPVEDCEFIAFVQDLGNKEVLASCKRGALDLTVGFEASATQVNKDEPVTFTNTTFGGYIGTPETYQWFFPGATPDGSTDENPIVTYWECGPHDVTLIVDRGGQIDTLVKSMYIQVGPTVNVTTNPGDTTCWYQPITLDATTPNAASYLWSPGGETTPAITVDGNTYGYGAHSFTVTVTSTDGCIQEKSHEIYFDECTGIADLNKDLRATVYPNPSNGKFTIELTSGKSTIADIRIVNILGNTAYSEKGITVNGTLAKNLNLNLASGIYYLVIQTPEGKNIQKITINN